MADGILAIRSKRRIAVVGMVCEVRARNRFGNGCGWSFKIRSFFICSCGRSYLECLSEWMACRNCWNGMFVGADGQSECLLEWNVCGSGWPFGWIAVGMGGLQERIVIREENGEDTRAASINSGIRSHPFVDARTAVAGMRERTEDAGTRGRCGRVNGGAGAGNERGHWRDRLCIRIGHNQSGDNTAGRVETLHIAPRRRHTQL